MEFVLFQDVAGEVSTIVASNTRRISANRFLSGNYAPVRELEDGATSEGFVVLEGAVPTALQGVFIRNGPNADRNPPLDEYHSWDGDGMLHAVWFGKDANGEQKLVYKNKFVDTLGRKVEDLVAQNHRDAVFSGIKYINSLGLKSPALGLIKKILPAWVFGLKQDSGEWGDTAQLILTKNVANTSIMFHHGKLMTLWEAGYPYELEPTTLETVGPYTFGGKLEGSMSAHPKVDPTTGDMVDVRYYLLSSPHCTVRVWNKKGELLHETPIEGISGPVLIHDCAITENYTVIPDLPLYFVAPWIPDAQDMGKETSPFCFKPERGGRIGVMPRFGSGEDIKWFDVSPNFLFHTFNAFEDGDKVFFLAIRSKDSTSGWDPVMNPEQAIGLPHGYELDMVTGEVKEFSLSGPTLEMPCLNLNFLGRKARYGFAGGLGDLEDNMRFTSCEKIDLLSPESPSLAYKLPEGCYAGQFAYVSKPPGHDVAKGVDSMKKNSSDGSDDGWLLSVIHNEFTDKSEIFIVDASNMSLAARVQLPARVPYGFHCIFVPEEELPPGYALM